MLRLIVFDFDGVLVDSNAVKQSAYGEALKDEVGAAQALATAQQRFPEADRFGILTETLKLLRGETSDISSDVQRYAERYNAICETYTATCTEILGVTEIMPAMRRNYSLAVNSDTPQEPLRRVVQQRGWSEWFIHVLGRPQTKEQNFNFLFETLQVMPGETLFLGDRERDRQAALHTGCFFVGVKNSFNNFAEAPEWMIDNLRGLPQLLHTSSFRRVLHV